MPCFFPFAFLLISAQSLQASEIVNFEAAPPEQSEVYSSFIPEAADPYRWMEDPAREAEVKQWLVRMSEHARAQLRGLRGYDAVARRNSAAFAKLPRETSVRAVSGWTFRLSQGSSDEVARLVARDTGGRDRTLFRPDTGMAINRYAVSPDARVVAVHLATGGREAGQIIFVRTSDGRVLPDRVAPVFGDLPFYWLDADTLVYTASPPESRDPLLNTALKAHRLAGTDAQDRTLLAAGERVDPKEIVAAASVSDRWLLARIGGARPESRFLVAPVGPPIAEARTADWREITAYSDQAISAAVQGDMVFFISTEEDENGALHSRNLVGSVRHDRIVKAPADIVLRRVVATRTDVYVVALETGIQRLFRLEDGELVALTLPSHGSVSEIDADPREPRATFSTSGWLINRRFHSVESDRIEALGIASETRDELNAFEVRNAAAVSADGTHIPLTIMAPKGPVRPGPTIVEAYAAYGLATTPDYFPPYHGWLESGGTYAICHARGGGEKGRRWHEAGRYRGKARGQDDLIACAEQLLALGYARSGELGALGGSAGGLVVAPAALRRPDLFRAVVLKAALLNPTRLMAARNGPNQYAEFGDPTRQEGFTILQGADAYLSLETAKTSPDWFLAVGLNDQRVEPWMSAKFASRALKRFGDKALVFVRADADAGHGAGTTASSRVAEMTDAYLFMLDRLKPRP